MCVIVDADVQGEVFNQATKAGNHFYNWLMKHGRIIIGGTKLKAELGKSHTFKMALAQLQIAGRAFEEEASKVDDLAEQMEADGHWKSNDWHIIALATLRRHEVRLLYSNDILLHEDFKEVVNNGSIYSTMTWHNGHLVKDGTLRTRHKKMLTSNLCRRP